ncbi:MAG: helix-turn-helix domain-containing protein [Vicinamibacterales bacterium]
MDSLITAAARALAAGDPLGALKRVALRADPPALALRGIALAQLGDLSRARALLQAAGRAFGASEPLARARCILAEAEVALASRDLGWLAKRLDAARTVLERHGDRINAAHARYVDVRRLLLIGRLRDAEQGLDSIEQSTLPAALRTVHALMRSGIAMRRIEARNARTALTHAAAMAREAGIPALTAEVESAAALLVAPAARLIATAHSRLLRLDDVERLLASRTLVVDACRNTVRQRATVIALARRPVLFELARTLADAWPDDAARETLVARAFGARHADESHRARLRVEIGRLRSGLRPLADINATTIGFVLVPRQAREVVVLARPIEGDHTDVLALLTDGESWSSSALAVALGVSQRSIQRALDALARASQVQSFGNGRARRWTMPPMPGFTTALLLPAPLPNN